MTAPPLMPPPAEVRLTTGMVVVWEADLDELSRAAPDARENLSPRERLRGERLRYGRDRRRFYARRTFLRAVLGRHLDRDPGSIRIEAAAGGKPAIAGAKYLRFNASSSGETALVAVSDAEIGVDIEKIDARSDVEALARRWLSTGEQFRVRRLEPSNRRRVVFAYLTRKEAVLKAAGVGLGLDPRLVSAATDVAGPMFIEVPALEPSSWWVTPLPMPGNMVGALATCNPDPRVIRLGWEHASAP